MIVTFNSADTLRACLESVAPEVEVVVVDQGSSDDSPALALAARADAVLVRAPANRGFGAGCNLGAARARGRALIFLNPDAQLTGDAAATLLGALERPGVGLAGPRILDAEGGEATQCRRFGSPLRDTVNLVLPQRAIPRALRQDIGREDPVYRSGGAVPYVQGSCMAITSERFAAAGGFDEAFFLYSEEEDLAERLRARGLGVWLEPRAAIIHIGHTSTQKTGSFATRHLFRSRALLYRKRYGRLAGALGGLLLAGGLTLLLITAPVRLRLGVRKAETASFCAAGLAGIAAALHGAPVRPPPPGARAGAQSRASRRRSQKPPGRTLRGS